MADFHQLWKSRLCIAVPKTNPLVSKKSLELRDLYGEHIITVKALRFLERVRELGRED